MPVFNSRSERASVQLRRRGRSWADEPSPPGKVERTGLPSLCHRGGTASSNSGSLQPEESGHRKA